MYKYIASIIFVSSVFTGFSIIPEITSNLTAQEQLQSEQQRPSELIAQKGEKNMTPGSGRDTRR